MTKKYKNANNKIVVKTVLSKHAQFYKQTIQNRH